MKIIMCKIGWDQAEPTPLSYRFSLCCWVAYKVNIGTRGLKFGTQLIIINLIETLG